MARATYHYQKVSSLPPTIDGRSERNSPVRKLMQAVIDENDTDNWTLVATYLSKDGARDAAARMRVQYADLAGRLEMRYVRYREGDALRSRLFLRPRPVDEE